MPANTKKSLTLMEMLHRQQALYSSALDLEKEFSAFLGEKNFKGIMGNSRAKGENQEQIQVAYEELIPLLGEVKNESGIIPDEEAEALRAGIKSTIDEINQLQQKNLDEITKLKESMLDNIKGTKQAKQLARGYKPSSQLRKSKYDTKS